jgi:hypothetical protein
MEPRFPPRHSIRYLPPSPPQRCTFKNAWIPNIPNSVNCKPQTSPCTIRSTNYHAQPAVHKLPRWAHHRRQEGSYFLQESKNAVGRLAWKLPAYTSPPGPPASAQAQPSPDVLPEILRHSVPIKGTLPPSETSLHASSLWTLPLDETIGVSPDVLNPLHFFVSLPQATFGPKRYRCGPYSLMVFRI